jgi:hypothetical protein
MPIASKYHGKKFKNVGIDLAKQEVKQNKIDKETAHAWALINLVASITGFILFVVDVATKLV